jgi:hypothetical protein
MPFSGMTDPSVAKEKNALVMVNVPGSIHTPFIYANHCTEAKMNVAQLYPSVVPAEVVQFAHHENQVAPGTHGEEDRGCTVLGQKNLRVDPWILRYLPVELSHQGRALAHENRHFVK